MSDQIDIKKFINYLKGIGRVDSQADFGKQLGYENEASFSRKLKSNVTPKFIIKIQSVFPEYNIWFANNYANKNANSIDINEKLTINDYKHRDGKFPEKKRFPKEVKIITAKSGLNLQSNYYADELIEELETRIIYLDHDAKGRYFEIDGEGDSMNDGSVDAILDGDKLLLREIPRIYWKEKFHIHKWDFTFFHYDRGFITKRIKEHKVETGDLLLSSRNPDKELYPDFWINLKECAIVCNVCEVRRQRGVYYSP